MKQTLLALIALLVVGCAPETPVGKPFWEANKLEIIIGDESTPGIHYQTNDVEKIKAFHDYIDHANTTVAEGCAFEGKMILY